MSDQSLPEPREPTIRDLTELCRGLNQRGALYIVIGGMAMIEHGMPRFTEDLSTLETKRSFREKDQIDAAYLRSLLARGEKL